MSIRREIISILGLRKAFIAFVFILVFISGCAYVPTKDISFITSSGGKLYFTMSDGRIRELDKKTLKWNDAAVPDMKKPVFINVFNDNGNILVQAVDYGWKDPSIYLLNEETGLKKAVDFKDNGIFATGADSDFIYFMDTEYKHDRAPEGDWLITGFRYDKNLKTKTPGHFDQFPDLLVTDVWEDKDLYWFACLKSEPIRNLNAPRGGLFLVSKSKTTGALERFELDGGIADWDKFGMDGGKYLWRKTGNEKAGPWDMAWVRGDDDYIWVFAKSAKSEDFLIRFSKAKKAIDHKRELIATLVPFHGRNAKGELWAVGEDYKTCGRGGKCVYRINKADLKSTTIHMPPRVYLSYYNWNFHNSNILRPFNPFYEDDDSLWLFAEQYRKIFTPSGCCVPYIVRVSKKDMTTQMIMIEPTVGEAVKTVLGNFIGWLLVPFFRG